MTPQRDDLPSPPSLPRGTGDPGDHDGQPANLLKDPRIIERLRRKLLKLRKQDPNIYPFF